MLRRTLIRCNNRCTRLRRVRVPPGALLVLVAHCLQRSDCDRNLKNPEGSRGGCARCGRCSIDALLRLGERTGVRVQVVGGGRQALAAVRAPAVKAVVALACERELVQGILCAFPKPVLAVYNTRPAGECHDTQVSLRAVEDAVAGFLPDGPGGTSGQPGQSGPSPHPAPDGA